MGQLLVRRLENGLIKALKERAYQNGRSVEAEHREILRNVLLPGAPKPSLEELLFKHMPDVGKDQDFEREKDPPSNREDDFL